ncbi:MAG: ribosomal subunit interface protein [Crocinitomicaceae bacterium]|nr:ribosomal subunit interface protein [Crocinitomicaceae bacterium]|tara:strand:+ start:447 stop:749 length:303 start_codon:yes stop_codon:yes gene_type:complete
MKLIIHSIHFDADKKLTDFIQKKADKLEQYYDGIVSGEVFLRLDKSETKENKIVEIKLEVPGNNTFAKKQSKSFEESTDLCVDALRRQLVKLKTKQKAYL